MPIYPYTPTLAPRLSLIHRRLFRRGLAVLGFLIALLIAALLRNS
jgi:hypothetical protein